MTTPTTEDLAQGKAYTAPGITVYYDARRCLHVASCVRGLPGVFDPQARPWIRPAHAEAEAVAAVVRTCPTGALHYVLDGKETEMPDEITTITPSPDGPLMIRGNLVIDTPAGEKRDVRAALCRCGQSVNKPYCDGTHKTVGWTSGEETGQAG
ncbi:MULTISPECIES: (4Fe-4S)-binding protein [unclassified Deinococcus]|uniref:(4Fe-4S)-binding protein n=1 Tax=unclassified Deinococcus TaxID=2623546 RepID=UPI001C2F526B|nr:MULTISPECIES: (4Fe-4S)-binding protein [unclassified Deinococcus]MDK2014616.1 (4Fe-4S)-binding protein [Deinococcus sp. 43]